MVVLVPMLFAVSPDAPVSQMAGRGAAFIILIAAVYVWRWITTDHNK